MSLKEKTVDWLKKNGPASLDGKTVLVTGANSGVGFATARIAAYLGAGVILACRNTEKAERAKDALISEFPDARVSLMKLDLADFSSIDAFAESFMDEKTDVDFFINNAGIFRQPGKKTRDGFELVIGTNYLGVYRLCERLLPYFETLLHPVTLINTVSLIHKIAKIEYGDFYYSKKYSDLAAYARSKLCLARYTYAAAKKHEGGNTKLGMTQPGIALTPLGVNAFGKGVKRLSKVLGRAFNSPEKSALAFAYVAAHNVPPGSIIGPTKFFGGWGYPKPNKVIRRVKEGADELMSFTESEIARTEKERQIRRIERFEGMMDEALRLMSEPDADRERLKSLVAELEAYYTGRDWKKDFADDEAGLLPSELKRGVLSEDGIDALLDEYNEL